MKLHTAAPELLFNAILPASLGVLAVLGFAPYDLYPITGFALVGLLALWRRAGRARQGAWQGFCFGLGFFGAGVHWPFVSIYHFGNAPWLLAVLLVCALVAYMALYPLAVGWLAAKTKRLPLLFWAGVFVPCAWLLAELLRGWGVTGFPWLSLGYSLINTPLAGLAAIGGVYFLSWIFIALAGVVLALLAGGLGARAASVAILFFLPWALWLIPAPISWTAQTGEPLSVAIIQGNIAQANKWDRAWFLPTLRRYHQLTQAQDADIIVWPEVAIPALKTDVEEYLQDIDLLAAAREQTVLAGVMTQHGRNYYNTVLALGAGQGQFDKRHLVPFGEYFPLPAFVKRWLDRLDMPYSNLGRGADEQPLIEADGVKIGVSICFEDAFGREVIRSQPAAGMLVNVTNDAWFEGTIAAEQHLEIARMRALETGRPMLRAANTGISAFIGPTGRIIERSQANEVTVLNTTIQPRMGTTPYSRWASWPACIIGLLGLLGGLAWQKARSKVI